MVGPDTSVGKTLVLSLGLGDIFYGVFTDDPTTLEYSDRLRLGTSQDVSEIADLLKSSPILSTTYDTVIVVIKSGDSTIIPSNISNPIRKSPFRDHYQDQLLGQNLQCLYAYDRQTIAAIKRLFPDCRVVSFAAVLSDYLYPATRKSMLLHIDASSLSLVSCDQEAFKHYQSAEAETKEDYLYFVMQSLALSHFDATEVTVLVSGDLFVESELYQMLKRYVKSVRFADPELLRLRSGLPDNVKHRYLELYAATLCA